MISIRHLKRIARHESRLTIDAKWELTRGLKDKVRCVLIDNMQYIIFDPIDDPMQKDWYCYTKQENPKFWLRVCIGGFYFHCAFDLMEFAFALLQLKDEDIGYYINHVRVSNIFKFVNEHILWKMQQQGMKPSIARYRLTNAAMEDFDKLYINVTKLLATYIQKTYGSKKRTTSKH